MEKERMNLLHINPDQGTELELIEMVAMCVSALRWNSHELDRYLDVLRKKLSVKT